MLKYLVLVGSIISIGIWAFSDREFKGLEWREKYLDKEGCIHLSKLHDESPKPTECPKKLELQIRPQTIGTLDELRTEAKRKMGKDLCCFFWETMGNR